MPINLFLQGGSFFFQIFHLTVAWKNLCSSPSANWLVNIELAKKASVAIGLVGYPKKENETLPCIVICAHLLKPHPVSPRDRTTSQVESWRAQGAISTTASFFPAFWDRTFLYIPITMNFPLFFLFCRKQIHSCVSFLYSIPLWGSLKQYVIWFFYITWVLCQISIFAKIFFLIFIYSTVSFPGKFFILIKSNLISYHGSYFVLYKC